MNKTTKLGLALYESNDKFNITANEDSLNHNMELIDETIGAIDLDTKQDKFGTYNPSNGTIVVQNSKFALQENTYGALFSLETGSMTSELSNVTTKITGGPTSMQLDPWSGITFTGQDEGSYPYLNGVATPMTDYQAANKKYVDTAINSLNSSMISRQIVTELPSVANGNYNVIYMVRDSESSENIYNEYMLCDYDADNEICDASVESTNNAGIFDGTHKFTVDISINPDNTDQRVYMFSSENAGSLNVNTTADNDPLSAVYNQFLINGFPGIFFRIKQTGEYTFNIKSYTEASKFDIIGTTKCDLSTKMDKFGTVEIDTDSNLTTITSPTKELCISAPDASCIRVRDYSIDLCTYDEHMGMNNVSLANNVLSLYADYTDGNGIRISGVEAPVENHDAVNKEYLDNIVTKSDNYTALFDTTGNGISMFPDHLELCYFVDGSEDTFLKMQDYKVKLYSEYTDGNTMNIEGVSTPVNDTDAANKAYVDSKAIFEDVGDGNAVTTTKTLIGFANGVTLMGDNIDFNGSEIHLNKDGRTFIKGQSVSIEGDGGLTALSISNNKVQVWGSDVDTLEDIYIPIVGAATPTASSPADQVATKEYVDSVKDYILLKDTATDETYKISVTNGKLSMEVVE